MKDYTLSNELIAGCDEAGRGCLAGPVFAAAVILPKGFSHKLLNDSKKVSAENRLILREIILKKAIAWGIGSCDHEEIDRINILNASFLAMHKAIANLQITPGFLIIDGNRFNAYPGISHKCIIDGDEKYKAIAAASILAKTERDAFMIQLHEQFPVYGWNKNKAYATFEHREALIKHGTSPLHRRSFRLDYQLELEFSNSDLLE